MRKWKLVVLPLALIALILSACPPKQVPEIQEAQAAIAAARDAGAAKYAPVKLKAAEEALAAAVVARKKKDYAEAVAKAKLAKKLADEARQEALAAQAAGTPPPPIEAAPTEAAPVAEERADYSQIFKTVYFDFDASDIKSEFRADLDSAAKYLNEHKDLKVSVTGHCDPRGTDEYNMALGERRAKAVKNYLVNAGVAANRINVVTKGESELLDASCNAEDCWAKERRGIFSVQ